jgi:hypothetical protein
MARRLCLVAAVALSGSWSAAFAQTVGDWRPPKGTIVIDGRIDGP